MTTITQRAPAATLPASLSQLKVLLSAHNAVHALYGGTGMTWDHPKGILTITGKPDPDGTTYAVAVTLRAAGVSRTTIDVASTITSPRDLNPAERAAVRHTAKGEALQESRDIIALLMGQVAKGVGRGFAARESAKGRGLTG